MIAIRFGKWITKGTPDYVYERVYMWTPFCRKRKRAEWEKKLVSAMEIVKDGDAYTYTPYNNGSA